MKIDSRLNLVIPYQTDDGKTVYFHSTPILKETFEYYFLPISMCFSELFAKNLNYIAGPRIAKLMLKKIAEASGEWEGDNGVKNGLLGEFARLTNVILPGPKGWQNIPMETAVNQGMLDDDDRDEIEGKICFFMVASAMLDKNTKMSMVSMAGKLWGFHATSSSCTEYRDSLQTSTQEEHSDKKGKASSIPA